LSDAPRDEAVLRDLEARFMEAVSARQRGEVDTAEDGYRAILAIEPRLPEPHLELAHLLVTTDRLSEAEEHAREALTYLLAGGQWVEDLAADEILGLAHATLAEILRRRADEDDVIFGDPEVFRALVAESREHFEAAARLDPSDDRSSYHAFFLGIPGAKVDLGDGLTEDDAEIE
jgi:tetratricopeptide (TPR) repeat protein